ncbi:MAG TPA: cation-transporting P-type ATPase [Chthoniobacteraceae bacterium]|jgi:calcium-translocating P-type ATPase|nr:cation-transporting P-type ATPase [Chthoniobacteraceae bacterium]
MKIHQLTVADALAGLRSNRSGLSDEEAQRRVGEFGRNEVQEVAHEALLLTFAREFVHFFALILWIAAGLAFFAEWREPGQGMATLGFAIVGVIVINGFFSFWQAFRAEQALAALKKLLPNATKVMRAGAVRQVPAAELVPGDVILLEAGDILPADCRLVEAFGVRVNNSTVTGESLPVSRDAAPCEEPEPMHARNTLLAGTSLVSGEATALVFATGSHSAFGKIALLTQATGDTVSPLQLEIARVSRIVAGLALALGVVFFFIGQAIGLPFWATFIFAIGIIVANVPEGLLPTVTLALAMGSQRMAKRNALIRHLPAVEALGCTTVICTDKTGTLTQNRMSARRVFIAGRMFETDQLAALIVPHRRFFEVAACCHDLKDARAAAGPGWLGDPMEVALVQLAAAALPELPHSPRVNEIPFDSERKRLSTVHATPEGRVLYCKGAPEVVLPRCTRVAMDGGAVALSEELAGTFRTAAEAMAEQGLRVLAFAWREMPEGLELANAEAEMTLAGLVGLEDPPRPEVAAALQKCRDAGIKVIMVTGDHPHTGTAIAREIGLVRSASPVVITGEQLGHLSDIQLQLALDAPEIIFARVLAEQKMRIVGALQNKREIVAVTGDGVNDAPALRKADVGIAMGRSGTDVAREAADMVLLDDNFASIVAAIEEGRAVFANIRNFLTYILTSNVPELIPYLAFVVFRIPLPLTVIQILAVDLGTDMLPALGLGAEKPAPDIMKAPPRLRTDRLLSWPLLARAYLFLGLLQAAAAMSAYWFILRRGGWQFGQQLAAHDPLYLMATTACLSAIVVMQVANVFLCRSERRSAFAFGLLSNKLILAGIVVEIALIAFIDYTPWGNALFGTAPIPPAAWLFIVPFALGLLALEELRKWFVRR